MQNERIRNEEHEEYHSDETPDSGKYFIGQFVHPVGGVGLRWWIGGIVILVSCEHHFKHENLEQYPSNNNRV